MSLELLSPAGSLEKMRFAAAYGADAVYAGAPGLSLRNAAETFSLDDLALGLAELHTAGKKLYLAANAFFHNDDLARFQAFVAEAAPLGFDGIILSDLGMIDFVRSRYPDLAVHVSTQANTTNLATARVYQRLGVQRIVLARELTLDEVRAIRDAVDLELEAFVHGAMCISYSGRCLLSNYFSHASQVAGGHRNANRGECTQVCRWEFALTEKTRPGELFPVEESEYGTAILSSRDLNMAPHLGDLIAAGVNSFKIEGRMKSAWYAAMTTRVYRHALDRAVQGQAPDDHVLAELDHISHREYSTGFYFQKGRGPDPTGALDGQSLRNSTQDQLLLAQIDGVSGGIVTGKALNPIRQGTPLLTRNPGFHDGVLMEYRLKVNGELRDLVRPTEKFELESSEPALQAMSKYSLLVQEIV